MTVERLHLVLLLVVIFTAGCDSGNSNSPETSNTTGHSPVTDSTPAANLPAESNSLESTTTPSAEAGTNDTAAAIYSNDFSTKADGNRIDQFVAYRDPFVVNHINGVSDHAPIGGINCSGPDETRVQTRSNPSAHVYQCLPGSDPALGHQMAYAMDSSGYGFVGALPDQVFEDLREVSVDINTTSAGSRNFIEIKVIPADQVYVNAMPCIPDLPCNDGWDYDDINAVGAGTNSQEGTGLTIATPLQPDGYLYDRYNTEVQPNGDYRYEQCTGTDFFFAPPHTKPTQKFESVLNIFFATMVTAPCHSVLNNQITLLHGLKHPAHSRQVLCG